MSCFLFCQSHSNSFNNTFHPPEEKTYFTSSDDYNKYLQSINNIDEEINTLSELMPNPDNKEIIKDTNNKISTNNKERGALHKQLNFISKDYNNIKYPNLKINCYSIKNPSNLKNEIILLRIKNKYFSNNNTNTIIFQNNNQEDSINEQMKSLNNPNNINYSNSSNNINYANTSENSFSVDSESIEKSKKITLIISHSNNSDLGTIFPKLCDLATLLKCDVISYDYSGYGCSNSKPKYDSLKNDLITVLNFSTNTFELKNEDIVLLSFDIGAIPTTHAGSKPEFCSIRGMILISPIINFIKRYNYDYINEIICPVFIIQAKYDENVEQKDLKKFAKLFEESIYWLPKIRHSDEIMGEYRYKFYTKIRNFLSHIQTTRIKVPQNLADSKENSLFVK